MKKLSEMTAAELTTALCEIAEPIGNISQDDEVVEALQKITKSKATNAIAGKLIGFSFSSLVPLLLQKHRTDTFAVLSVLAGKTLEELEKENGFRLIRDIRGLFSSEMMRFFGLSADMV